MTAISAPDLSTRLAQTGTRAGDVELWAVTCYFNPAGYRRRLENYRVFRERLMIPLVAVELAYRRFELNDGDAEILVQLRGGDILWQKERLLNLAIEVLPPHCRKVAWLDCDIIFQEDDWAERTTRLLDRHPLVQPFGRVRHAPRDWRPGQFAPLPGSASRSSLADLVRSGTPPADCLHTMGGANGYAWAADRDLLEEHGHYDACIVGGGDGVMARAAYGQMQHLLRLYQMNDRQKDHCRNWAIRFHDSVRSDVGLVDGELIHLWHGNLAYRRYSERLEGLSRFRFDPVADIARGSEGAWRWNTDKPDLHEYVRTYFISRKEDG